MNATFNLIMDIVGTIAFAISGVMVASKKKMDLFGINILALCTAVGGGMVRDVLIGVTPPVMFRNPIFVIIALVTANLTILILYFHKKTTRKSIESLTTQLLFIFDTLGLAAFTMDGVNAGMAVHHGIFLPAFLGVMTGVGGGIIRDVLANELPQVCIKQIYASASIIGAIITCLFMKYGETNAAVVLGFIIVVLIRVLAAHYRWDLPTIDYCRDKNKK